MIDGCEHVGCDIRPTSCQIDHIAEWLRDGGTTDLVNGALKCSTQNRNKHRLGITETRDANGTLVQYRPDGTPILPVGRRLRHHEPGTGTPDIEHRALGPVGNLESSTCPRNNRGSSNTYASSPDSWSSNHSRSSAVTASGCSTVTM